MSNPKQHKASEPSGFVNVKTLIEKIFTDPKSRPCSETIERAALKGAIPSVKLGRLRFYSVEAVREALIRNGGLN